MRDNNGRQGKKKIIKKKLKIPAAIRRRRWRRVLSVPLELGSKTASTASMQGGKELPQP